MDIILNSDQERILKHLLSLQRNSDNEVYIGNQMDTYPPNIKDKKLIRILHSLDDNGLIRFKMNGTHKRDLYVAADITILPSADAYFIKKKHEKWNRIRSFLELLPAISVGATILGIIYKLLAKLI